MTNLYIYSKRFSAFLTLILGFVMTLQAQEWEQMTTIDFDRNHGIGFAIGQYGYILTGGDSKTNATNFHSKTFNRYDSTTDSWEELDDYPGPSRGLGIGAVYEDIAYFGFGRDGNGNNLSDLWTFDPATDAFEELPSCPCVGRTHPAFVVTNGKIYMGTGSGPNGNLGDWWEYDIESQLWFQRADIPGARHHPYMFEIDGEVHVGSGHRETWFKYDATNDAWIQLANLDTRVAGTQFSYEGRGYALSGVDNDHKSYNVGEFWQYIPEIDSWLAMESHPGISRWAPTSFVIDGYVYLATGWVDTNGPIPDRTVWRFNLEGLNPSSSKDNEVDFDLTIFPNPTTDYLHLDLTDNKQLTSVKILDQQGRLVLDKHVDMDRISVEDLTAGMYWLYFEIEGDTFRKIFVKQ